MRRLHGNFLHFRIVGEDVLEDSLDKRTPYVAAIISITAIFGVAPASQFLAVALCTPAPRIPGQSDPSAPPQDTALEELSKPLAQVGLLLQPSPATKNFFYPSRCFTRPQAAHTVVSRQCALTRTTG